MSSSSSAHPHLTNWPQDRAVATSSGRYVRDTYCCLNGTTSTAYPSAWYALDAGPARLYMLDSAWANSNVGTADLYENDFDYHWTETSPEWRWLQADLESHPRALKFAFFHFPVYSDQQSENSDTWLQGPSPRLEGLLAENGVQIAFTGHAHLYERNRKSVPGLVTYLSGGGGAELQSIGGGGCSAIDAYGIGWSDTRNRGNACGGAPVPTSRAQVFHFLLVTVNPVTGRVTVAPTNSLGQTFDVQTYTFAASPPPAATPTPTPTTLPTATPTATPTSLPAATPTATATATPTAPPAGTPTTLTFSPDADSYVDNTTPNTNFGSSSTLKVDTSPNIRNAYLRFTISGASGTIESAKLRLFSVDPTNDGPQLFATSNTWTESSITWNNQPGPIGTASDDKAAIGTNVFVEYDVTPLVAPGNGTYSFALIPQSTDGFDMASRQATTAANRPQLVLSVAP
jgi:hypothetical protein